MGFGHTTRCVSLIKKLLDNQNEVHVAGNEAQIEFYRNDFPGILQTHLLEGYNIKLDPDKSTYWQMAIQGKNLKKKVHNENEWLKCIQEKERFEIIISDNRFGFRLDNVPSIVICHQLNLQIPIGGSIANKINSSYLNKFNFCWVPDTQNRKLTGDLSKNKLDIPTKFIGPLNRFECEPNQEKTI